MLNQKFKPEPNRGWLPSFNGRQIYEDRLRRPTDTAAQLLTRLPAAPCGELPVMPATILGLELLLQEPCIDLRLASELVLNDVGATLQILRLIGLEYEHPEDRPSRMQECIASLDSAAWFHAVSHVPLPRDSEAASQFWKHSRSIAHYSQLVAGTLEGICTDEAYLVGLLHDMGSIPKILGWAVEPAVASDNAGTMLAMEWELPPFVSSALRSLAEFRTTDLWFLILSEAHRLAAARGNLSGVSVGGCCSNREQKPGRLVRNAARPADRNLS